MAPEYALWGYLTYKADVFSFAVVALEILAGTSNMKYRPNENYVCLVDWVSSQSFPSLENLKSLTRLHNCSCHRDHYSLHINCGGRETTIGGITYEGDRDAGGAAKFVPNMRDNRWGVSSTGDFWDVNATSNDYEKLGLKDFTLKKQHKKIFNKVQVMNNVLEIRFQWSGKGTTSAPKKGTWSSHISYNVILVKSNIIQNGIDCYFFISEVKPPDDSKRKIIILIVIGVVVLLLCLMFTTLCILWWKGCFDGTATRERELRGLDLQTGIFTFRQIKAATNNFDPTNEIGEGGFGTVYKGTLLDGTIIAVKQLSSKSQQGNREFVTEMGMVPGLQHPNLVKLYGCCIEGNQLMLLVYEYMENNSHASASFGISKVIATVDIWRQNTPYGGYLTYKADVYSFGAVALEIVAGKNNLKYRPNENFVCLVDWAIVLQQKGNLMELVDPNLGSDFNKEEAVRMIKVAILCINPSPALRPTMSTVVSVLKGRTAIPELIMDPSIYGDELRLMALRKQFNQIAQHDSTQPIIKIQFQATVLQSKEKFHGVLATYEKSS
ncbi:putative LRR receptor-like serine/threonine-protein kinase [Morus notabilis]|uniref:Putative LRR receptor-like serine/threonine-protein kinase n=1 Tax=Morus notabilis TaxID=981085 RepID=W9R1X6_9ROSA|nr:putative LRR receptor-like serine/threonine-protein kinase [Morus notabilis]